MSPHALSIARAAAAIRRGELSSVGLVQACLDHIRDADGPVRAWAWLDPQLSLDQARDADRARRDGRPLGPLHGVPVGVKDVFDAAGLPAEFGSPIHAGRRPAVDAVAVARLRAAGAVILGKTVTTEFAYYHPGKTANPHDPRRTPGGSSSGSAAAVAALMVPGAIGTQTNGSVIRPAAFCGVVGFKPTHGLIPRTGALLLSRALDHVGTFTRTVEDAALMVDAMAGPDAGDPDARAPAAPLAGDLEPRKPRLAFVRTPVWDQAEPATRQAVEALASRLGAAAVDLPAPFDAAVDFQRIVMDVEMARNLRREYDTARDRLSDRLRTLIERGRATPEADYRRAIDGIAALNRAIQPIFAGHDAILTPSAPGEAPLGLDATGNPIFCTIWTYLGTPAITLPLLKGPAGMPLGVQLVAARGADHALLRAARWLEQLSL
ncbi:MAG: amidase [Alphaproteobacteria bacterium]|nr:amidase [Alphaproteobacteria bacterium]